MTGSRAKRRRRARVRQFAVVGSLVAGLAVLTVALIVMIRPDPVTNANELNDAAASEAAAVRSTQQSAEDSVLRAAFVGDSYTSGARASTSAKRWTTIVAMAHDWTEINLGRGGTGYLNTSGPAGCGRSYCPNYVEMVRDAVNSDPDVVVVAGGQNDFRAFARSPKAVVAAVDDTYTSLRAALPRARIIAVGPSSPGATDASVKGLDTAVQSAASSVGAQYVSLIHPRILDPQMIAADGAHPNDLGYAAIASAFDRAVPPT